MPFVLNYDDGHGHTYPESFWIISSIVLNHLAETANIVLDGHTDVICYNSGFTPFEQRIITFNDPTFYESYIKWELETSGTGVSFSFYWYVEQAIIAAATFLTGATEYSVAAPKSLEIGGETDSRVTIAFSNQLTGVNSNGTTIKINGVPATISSAGTDSNYTFPPDFGVLYNISPTPLASDVVTWAYDGGFPGSGTLTDPGLLPVRKFGDTVVTNRLGRFGKFNTVSNSGQIVTLGL